MPVRRKTEVRSDGLTDDQMSDERLPEFVGSRHVMRVVGQVVMGLAESETANATSDKRALTQKQCGPKCIDRAIIIFTFWALRITRSLRPPGD